MGTIRIKVTVGCVYPPKSIRVFIDNMDDAREDYEFKSPKSFDHLFTDIPSGNYIVTISGMNQADDQTEIMIGGDFEPNDSCVNSDNNYQCVFVGKV